MSRSRLRRTFHSTVIAVAGLTVAAFAGAAVPTSPGSDTPPVGPVTHAGPEEPQQSRAVTPEIRESREVTQAEGTGHAGRKTHAHEGAHPAVAQHDGKLGHGPADHGNCPARAAGAAGPHHAAAGAAGGHGGDAGRMHSRQAPGEMRCVTRLLDRADEHGLSPEQVSRLRDAATRYRKETIERHAEIRLLQVDLEALQGQEDAELGEVRSLMERIADRQIDQRLAGLEVHRSVHDVLTPEQREALHGRHADGGRHSGHPSAHDGEHPDGPSGPQATR